MYQDHMGNIVFKIGDGFSDKLKKKVVLFMDHDRDLNVIDKEVFDGRTFHYTKGFVPRFVRV